MKQKWNKSYSLYLASKSNRLDSNKEGTDHILEGENLVVSESRFLMLGTELCNKTRVQMDWTTIARKEQRKMKKTSAREVRQGPGKKERRRVQSRSPENTEEGPRLQSIHENLT